MAPHAQPAIAGYQTWNHLLFLHWRVDPGSLQDLLPDGLQIETFDGAAWLGLVPFSMERVRPWWSPPVPGISWFLETNVRTYVRDVDGRTGVWFFSLDANHRLAVAVARRFWNLNYVRAELCLQMDGGEFHYKGRRVDDPATDYEITATPASSGTLLQAESGTLEHFLLERYHLFSRSPGGNYFYGQVHHEPYSFCSVASLTVRQKMLSANGVDVAADAEPDHAAYSPGVDVLVSPLIRL